MLASIAKKLFVVSFLFSCVGISHTAEGKEFFANYEAQDILNKTSWNEIWRVRLPGPSTDADTDHQPDKILIKQRDPNKIEVVELMYFGQRIRFTPDNRTSYFKETLNSEMAVLPVGGTAFGRAELLDAKTGKIVDQWPVFVEKQSVITNGIRLQRLIYKAIQNGGVIFQIIQDYIPSEYPFLRAQEIVTTRNGTTVVHTIHKPKIQE